MLKQNITLSKLKTRHKFTSQEIQLLKKIYNEGIKKSMPYSHYLIFVDINAPKIKSFLRKIHSKSKKNLRGGFLSLILSAIAAISAAATTAAPVIASAVTAAAPIVAGAGLATATQLLVEKAVE